MLRVAFILAALALSGCPRTGAPPVVIDGCENTICDESGDCWCDSHNSGEES